MNTAMPDAEHRMRLYEDLGSGLHAMAQPLTVLRGALGALAMRGGVAADSSRYVEMSTQQVERLCNLMFRLQDLLDAHQYEAACAKVDLWAITESLVEDDDPTLRESGVRIAAAKPDRHVHVAGDPARTEQAIRAALSAARAMSSQGDVLHLGVMPGDGFAHLTVENRNSQGRSMKSSDRLRLSLAEANIRSQQGVYEFVEDPFRVSMRLPLYDEQERNIEAASDCASLEEVQHLSS
jgi:hypothetical protein